MRVLFAGTPAFAAPALQAILAAGHDVALVLTQPDRPSGRGLALRASPVKALAQAHGVPVLQPQTLRVEAVCAQLEVVSSDVFVVAAYGLILPQAVLDLPRWGCLNIHASLLPRWRGAAPIQRALLAGDCATGVSIMQMEAGLDTGPVLLRETVLIDESDTGGSLHERLSLVGARLIVDALAQLPMPAVAQAEEGITYAAKIDKDEAVLDWRRTARSLARQVRAFDPFPGARCTIDGIPLKVWRPEVIDGEGAPGEVVAADARGVVVACGQDALRVCELQRPGGKRLAAAHFLAGTPIRVGTRCPLPVS